MWSHSCGQIRAATPCHVTFELEEHTRSSWWKGLLGKKQLYSQPFYDPFQLERLRTVTTSSVGIMVRSHHLLDQLLSFGEKRGLGQMPPVHPPGYPTDGSTQLHIFM